MTKELLSLLSGEVLEDDLELTLAELCRACRVPAEHIIDLVDEGLVEPLGSTPARWRFRGICLRRVRCALRLQRDLGVNIAGAALALDLLEELEFMRARLKRLSD
jgi:chaperone modulatory protein CbpM